MLRSSLMHSSATKSRLVATTSTTRSMNAATRRSASRALIEASTKNNECKKRRATIPHSSSMPFSSLALFQNLPLSPRSSMIGKPVRSPLISIQKRNYIFLPSSFSDIYKSILNFLHTTNTHRMELVLKLRDKTRQSKSLIRTKLRNSSNNHIKRREKIKTNIRKVKTNLHTTKIRLSAKRDALRIRYTNFVLRHSFYHPSTSHFYLRRRASSGLLRLKGWMAVNNTSSKQRLRHKIYDRVRKNYLQLLKRQQKGTISTSPLLLDEKGEEQKEGEIEHYKTKKIIIDEPSSPKWFDKNGYPLTSRDDITGRFVNPWNSDSTDGDHGLWDFIRWRWSRIMTKLKERDNENELLLKHEKKRKQDLGACGELDTIRAIVQEAGFSSSSSSNSSTNNKDSKCWADLTPPSNKGKIKLTWIGHSTTLIQQSSYTLLTDPIFSNRASPIQSSSIFNSFTETRYVPPACTISHLPDTIDVVLLSHDHYDHLDYNSICELVDSDKVKYWVVPLGMKKWLMDRIGVRGLNIVELEWWESVTFVKSDTRYDEKGEENDGGIEIVGLTKEFSAKNKKKAGETKLCEVHSSGNISDIKRDRGVEMVVTCAPAQHWCSRTPFDRNQRLWCSWAVRTTEADMSAPSATGRSPAPSSSLNFYFAGDTGLPQTFPLHRQIGDRLGPFQLSALPIGAYEPSFFMRDSHCNPKEAVKMHLDLKSEKSVGVHWGTFALADERYDEPPLMLRDALREVQEKEEQKVNRRDTPKGTQPVNIVVVPQGNSVESLEEQDMVESKVDSGNYKTAQELLMPSESSNRKKKDKVGKEEEEQEHSPEEKTGELDNDCTSLSA